MSKDILEVEEISKDFIINRGLFKKNLVNKAVDHISLNVKNEEMFGLVGESGCGKSTLARIILRLMNPTSGRILFDNEDITKTGQMDLKAVRQKIQVVFQDPYSSLNPRMKVMDLIGRGLEIHNKVDSKREKKALVVKWLERVGMGSEHLDRYIHEFSGGQLQRIAIARALCIDPKFIILDEPTSALDVSIQAQICNLLKELKESLSLTFLFISHNLAVVRYLSDRIGVMYLGRLMETGTADVLFDDPLHPYTRALLSAVPTIDQQSKREIIRLEGDLPSPSDPPQGCHFHPRCPEAMPRCRESYPDEFSAKGHSVRCFLHQ